MNTIPHRRADDRLAEQFAAIPAVLGRFWLLVVAASPVITWLLVLLIGMAWRTDAVQTVVLALRNQP